MKIFLLKIFLIILLTSLSAVETIAQSRVVVANGIGKSEITVEELKNVFKPKFNKWPNGAPVVIVLPGQASVLKDGVASEIYNSTFSGVQKYWLSLVFQGRFDAPYFFDTDEEVIRFVSKTKGAIGFVSGGPQVPESLLVRIKSNP